MEKEAVVVKKEIKISLPVYKIVYAVCFIVILSLIRGITYSSEIGIALEAQMAILSLVFCSDTYVNEIISKRAEVHRLYPIKNRVHSQYSRIFIQIVFMLILAIIGYGLFWIFQHPISGILTNSQEIILEKQNELYFFATYIVSVFITISFWGILSNTFACLFRNMWGGIGVCVLFWIALNSNAGNDLLGKWNIFSYTFQNIENVNDLNWMCGKVICLGVSILFMLLLPVILKKRG